MPWFRDKFTLVPLSSVSNMRETIEYWLVVAVAKTLGRVPRGIARMLAGLLAIGVYSALGRLRRVGARNLTLALPELSKGCLLYTSDVYKRQIYMESRWWVLWAAIIRCRCRIFALPNGSFS